MGGAKGSAGTAGRAGTTASASVRQGDEQRALGRIRALLAKAESTTFPEEAEALTAKAQELMARHAIDEALLAAAENDDATPPGCVRLPVEDPYAGSKALLLSQVASANRCRAVWTRSLGYCTVVGFAGDLEFVDLLYTSLLVQAGSAMLAAGSQVDRYGRSRTRSFRQAFLVSYAIGIGQRLRAAEAVAEGLATKEHGEALLPVLAGRTAAVDEACDAAFPKLQTRPVSVSNRAGWEAGASAAEISSLATRTQVDRKRGLL